MRFKQPKLLIAEQKLRFMVGLQTDPESRSRVRRIPLMATDPRGRNALLRLPGSA